MPEDDKKEVVIEEGTEVTPEEPKEPDFQAKLNATNRFLEKEGYTFNGETKRWEKPAVSPKESAPLKADLSGEDIYALIEAKVQREDFEKVKDYAGFRKISISEALSDKTLKVILSESAEERKTELARQGGKGNRSPEKATPEAILEKARAGKLPEGDDEIAALAKASLGGSKK